MHKLVSSLFAMCVNRAQRGEKSLMYRKSLFEILPQIRLASEALELAQIILGKYLSRALRRGNDFEH